MLKVSAPVCAPGCCYICKTSKKIDYLDTEQESPDGTERIYICFDCLEEAAGLLGFLSTPEADKLREKANAFQGRFLKAAKELAAVKQLKFIANDLAEIGLKSRRKEEIEEEDKGIVSSMRRFIK